MRVIYNEIEEYRVLITWHGDDLLPVGPTTPMIADLLPPLRLASRLKKSTSDQIMEVLVLGQKLFH